MAQALFDSLQPEDYKGGLLVLGGDGRYFNREAAQVFGPLLEMLGSWGKLSMFILSSVPGHHFFFKI